MDSTGVKTDNTVGHSEFLTSDNGDKPEEQFNLTSYKDRAVSGY